MDEEEVTHGEGSVKVVCRLLVQEKDDVAAMEWVFAVFSKEGEASIAKWVEVPALQSGYPSSDEGVSEVQVYRCRRSCRRRCRR